MSTECERGFDRFYYGMRRAGRKGKKGKFNFMDHKIVGLVGKRKGKEYGPEPRLITSLHEIPKPKPLILFPPHQSGRRQGRPHVDHTKKKYFFSSNLFFGKGESESLGNPITTEPRNCVSLIIKLPPLRHGGGGNCLWRRGRRRRGEFLSAFCLTTKPC